MGRGWFLTREGTEAERMIWSDVMGRGLRLQLESTSSLQPLARRSGHNKVLSSVKYGRT